MNGDNILNMSRIIMIRNYQQRCSAEYSASIKLPEDYRYPTGNPIRPIPPIETCTQGLMIIGAYPSARFESRPSRVSNRRRLVPVADNLQPFGTEVYFDGVQVRRLESGAGLNQYLLEPLGLKREKCWITDLVKVFLYKPEHANSCAEIFPEFKVNVLRPAFSKLGRMSVSWIREEIDLCEPKVIITLGEEVAKIVSGSKLAADELLVPEPSYPELLDGHKTYYCPHPDACRRSPQWRERMQKIVQAIIGTL